MNIINTSAHVFRTWSEIEGEVPVEWPPCGVIINATPVEELAGTLHRECGDAQLVKTKFVASPEEEAKLAALEIANPEALIVGSIIAAQAFPGRILVGIPCQGYERVPPDQKRVREDKFTTF